MNSLHEKRMLIQQSAICNGQIVTNALTVAEAALAIVEMLFLSITIQLQLLKPHDIPQHHEIPPLTRTIDLAAQQTMVKVREQRDPSLKERSLPKHD